MTGAPRLPAFGLFAAMLAAAGLPLYIHAPKFYVDEYGVSLAALGTVLFALRLLDVVQDPLLGRLAARLQETRAVSVAVAVLTMAAAMVGLFAVEPLFAPLIWFALMLTLVFSSFSYLTICFYAEGVSSAGQLTGQGHLQLARWRETGALLGICAASVAPVLIGGYGGFALAFAVLAGVAIRAMHREWRGARVDSGGTGFLTVLRDPVARKLLLVALFNAAPVAVSSTLFLFFVESRLQAPGWEGPFLLLFFLSAALAAPFWGKFAERAGERRVLLIGMVLSILSFGSAVWLGAGDTWAFGLICLASGAALGADMTLLPALFARRMADISPGASEAFGLWSFVSKFTLAFAAVTLLPLLEAGGFEAGGANGAEALWLLSLLYGALPCVLKLLAIGLLASIDFGERSVRG
ncbi:MFS transporter [Roseovarius indicus]|uniref:Sugar (Glycoside-Pentoside-Hexuronide) transporter n=1 Tax=Roseovarius indicus TaxID=540747 RepID=A0A0T5PEL5_9RHOB|nr:MFS transporter [Roseovarius indicus]KRS19605.1 sugar:cation symporter [Roseovarius indicus]QEW29060.1 sugar (Glycoside-Pentoside-Hexuronide) transporter [Roseovarius indicus]SFD80504.1 glycoside/pentoside/hexuronide:cation symporter, GPH family [Roseovarius indicus]